MNNRSTYILASITGVILTVAVIVGVISAQTPATPIQPQQSTPQPVNEQALTAAELSTLLEVELPAITSVFTQTFPAASELYTIDQGRLYKQGQWYGTTLTYKGSDEANRDTLRVLMQKKDGAWIVRTNPPQLLLSTKDLGDVPVDVIQSLNQPAPLPGTATSPAIN
ncbi:hypothetical protein A2707_04310 [Candidatus Saccharibacteria bacterium RIFCSPHIGHO2_01_FULL_45_15]|nr:MAG: hypothetical protein A2707_04310 [Candidatus Saccharibacteria bacterium RIFCSPHIGHO2_01_FULL_45_15]OGL27163.1 MAG: hypothetical protein A3C39_01205 [Candidatus Saccharibacteria bacterium RIFCSPHIGHO2_02_FULL_46_12]OGL32797.1 MAG: hypothetical protein A3E76_05650 [Candidatus Saccharibacteria bacterium RIFCSPHIGHO2_12_FULL_44_22]